MIGGLHLANKKKSVEEPTLQMGVFKQAAEVSDNGEGIAFTEIA